MDNEDKKFECVLCGTNLPSKEALQEHFRRHANKEIDSKGNPVKSTLKKEQNNGEKDEKIQTDDYKKPTKENVTCDVCGMKYDTVNQAIQHKFRKHPESSVKFYCPYCGMQFPLKYTRDKHVATHMGMSNSMSFPCPDCGVIFYNAPAQTYHIKSTHKRIMAIFKPVPTPPPSKKIKINNANQAQSVYYCYLCGSEYIIKFNLQRHLERSHTEEERNAVPEDLIKCTTCDALFYNKKAYDMHNMYHRPDDLYVTSEEQRLQTVTRVDQDFDIRRVQFTADKFIPVDKPKPRRNLVKKEVPSTEVKKTFDSDEELSPISSIDSSDSEDDNEKSKKDKNQPGNSKESEIKNQEKKTTKTKPKVKTIIVKKIGAKDIKNIASLSKVKNTKNVKGPLKTPGTTIKKIKLSKKSDT